MKKITLLLFVLMANYSLISCTAESIMEGQDLTADISATNNENETKDPIEDLPPSGEN